MGGKGDGGYGEVLRNRRFAALLSAQLVSGFGDWLSLLSVMSLLAFREGGSASAVGGVVMAFTAPVALVGPLAGVLVDRWDLKRTMVASDLIRASLVVMLAFAPTRPALYSIVFALSSVSVFFAPAQASALPLVVDKGQLLAANALASQLSQLNRILSPAVAGALVGLYGERACFFVDGLTFVVSAALLSTLRLRREPSARGEGGGSVVGELKGGLAFVFGNRRVRFVTFAMAAAVLASAAVDALTPVYIRDLLGGDSRLLGLLMACVAGGTIAGALLVGRYGRPFDKVRLVLLGIIGVGLGVLALAAASNEAGALGAGFGLGALVPLVLLPSQTLIQEETPQGLLGRVFSITNLTVTLAQLASVGAAGLIADAAGIRGLYYGAALALLTIGAAGLLHTQIKWPPHALSRRLRKRISPTRGTGI